MKRKRLGRGKIILFIKLIHKTQQNAYLFYAFDPKSKPKQFFKNFNIAQNLETEKCIEYIEQKIEGKT